MASMSQQATGCPYFPQALHGPSYHVAGVGTQVDGFAPPRQAAGVGLGRRVALTVKP
jgi:hypothetical protein